MNFPDIALNILREQPEKNILLVSGGGSGKTTSVLETCRRLLCIARERKLTDKNGICLVPVYIPLASCDEGIAKEGETGKSFE